MTWAAPNPDALWVDSDDPTDAWDAVMCRQYSACIGTIRRRDYWRQAKGAQLRMQVAWAIASAAPVLYLLAVAMVVVLWLA
jgi:hypothetical protein